MRRPISHWRTHAAHCIRGVGLAFGFAVAGAGVAAQSKEVDLDATMKKVGPAFAALRKSIESMDANLAKQNTAVLKTAFADVEGFFEAKGKHDAHQWAS